jgi:hypothetical protein
MDTDTTNEQPGTCRQFTHEEAVAVLKFLQRCRGAFMNECARHGVNDTAILSKIIEYLAAEAEWQAKKAGK